jgi:dihydrofolate reductase
MAVITSTHVYIGTSLDGFIARPNGEIDWLTQFADKEAFDSYDEFMSGIDVIVIGRGTFETVLKFPRWPYDRPVFVLSNSITEVPELLKEKVSIICLPPAEVITLLSDKGLKGAYIDGGKVIQSFLAEDLIDELTISRAPVLIGRGISLFGTIDFDIRFSHVQTKVCSNGLVRSYYKRQR